MLKINKSISLIGMPGAGKTSIGREIAKLTSQQFYDADVEIEKSAGREITDIFDEFGEKQFREGETKVIKRILNEKCILATGGGAFINDKTRNIINQDSISIFIDVDLETLWERIKGRNHRPLLNGEYAKIELEKIFQKRYDIYKQADIVVKYNNKKSPAEMAKLIIKNIKENEKD